MRVYILLIIQQQAHSAWAQQVVELRNGTYLMAFPGMGGKFNWTYPGGVGLASSSTGPAGQCGMTLVGPSGACLKVARGMVVLPYHPSHPQLHQPTCTKCIETVPFHVFMWGKALLLPPPDHYKGARV